MVWKIKNFPGGKEFLLRCKFGLPSVEAEEEQQGRMPPIRVSMELCYFTISGIQVGRASSELRSLGDCGCRWDRNQPPRRDWRGSCRQCGISRHELCVSWDGVVWAAQVRKEKREEQQGRILPSHASKEPCCFASTASRRQLVTFEMGRVAEL